MNPRHLLVILLFCFVGEPLCLAQSSSIMPVAGDPLTGTGDVNRSLVTYKELFSSAALAAPVDDSAFALPANAAMPKEVFEGRLMLSHPASSAGHNKVIADLVPTWGGDLDWKRLPSFSFEFVQNGSHLIPVKQGLIFTGDPVWNYIIGPGRVWLENGDSGYTRASFPFALVARNQNCVHNGEMMFLFSNTKSVRISKVRYQVTQETCSYFKFDLWGQISATYTPSKIANSIQLKNDHASEIANRIPSKPFAALITDFPGSGLDLSGFFKTVKFPKDITTYGLYINGTHYVSNCPTRYGEYAFCDQMRLPSYSVAKSAFAGIALMRLGEVYGPAVYKQLIHDYLPQYVLGGDWSKVTFENTLGMATGNYINPGFEVDENGPEEGAFFKAESYEKKIANAFGPFPHKADPGNTWIYQSHATFLLTQAMTGFLQKYRGSDADLFNSIRDEVYRPIHVSKGGLTTIRTGNSETGRPSGYFGLFYTQDDVVKIAKFLNIDRGRVHGVQLLDPVRIQRALFQDPSALGLPVPDQGAVSIPDLYHYNDGFWDKRITPAAFPQYTCDFWIPYMSGYGGITVLLLPNGAIYYVFSDANEFNWINAVHEINKIKPFCNATKR